jgi:hypothetical protein
MDLLKDLLPKAVVYRYLPSYQHPDENRQPATLVATHANYSAVAGAAR